MDGPTSAQPARFGLYDKRVQILTVATTVGDDGSPRETESLFANRWASIDPVGTGREYALAAQIMADVSLVVECRYVPGVTPKHRVRCNGRVLEIAFCENVKEQNRVTRLYCKEKVS